MQDESQVNARCEGCGIGMTMPYDEYVETHESNDGHIFCMLCEQQVVEATC